MEDPHTISPLEFINLFHEPDVEIEATNALSKAEHWVDEDPVDLHLLTDVKEFVPKLAVDVYDQLAPPYP